MKQKLDFETLAKDALPIIQEHAIDRNADYDLVVEWCKENPEKRLIEIFHYRVDATQWIIYNFETGTTISFS